jgi:hypothetical protein
VVCLKILWRIDPLLDNARNNRRTVFSIWSVPRCYNRDVRSSVDSQLSSERESVKMEPECVKLKNLHC